MKGPKHKDYEGIESGLGFGHPLARTAHDLRDGLRLLSKHLPPGIHESAYPLTGMLHEEDASYFWVQDRGGEKVRVKLEREEQVEAG